MGLSCDGYEDYIVALFSIIDADRDVSGVELVLDVSEKSGNRDAAN